MSYETITCTQDNQIGRIVLNRPDVMNSLNAQMRAELAHAFRTMANSVRVIVLSAEGKAFCAGQDLGAHHNMAELNVSQLLRDEYGPMIEAIEQCEVPTVACVHSIAAGAGAALALACDIVVAGESASFLQAFTRIGLIPDAGGTYWLPRQIGMAKAMGAALLAEPVSARQADDWGMIWKAVPDEALQDTVEGIAKQLANGPTEAYRLTKQALRSSFDNTRDVQAECEAMNQGAAASTRDFAEGVNAFLEKRAPDFKGH